MPKIDPAFLVAVCQYKHCSLPQAIRWARWLTRPLSDGARVDSFTVLKGPVRT